MTRRVVGVAAGLLSAGLAVSASQSNGPQATFTSRVDIVDVDVSVLGEDRMPVSGLTAADFVVFEDGKPRPIVSFSAVELPRREMATARWMDEVSPDVATNAVAPAGRLVALILDQSIGPAQVPRTSRIAETVLSQLRPGDLAAVIFTAYGVAQSFTSDPSQLAAAVSRPFTLLPEGDGGDRSECHCGACSLETIADVAESLHDVHQRRRLVVYIGTDIRTQTTGVCGGMITTARDRALRAVAANNVTVHVIDPTGLETLAPSASSTTFSARASMAAALARRNNLYLLPDNTNGRALFGVNDPVPLVADVFRESASYYLLGFEPASRENRTFHDITVKVPGRNVIVQARSGYYAPGFAKEPKTSWTKNAAVPRPLRDAVAGLWPSEDLKVEMTTVPLALPGLREAVVGVTLAVKQSLDAARLAFVASNGQRERTVNVLVGAFDRNGRSLGYTNQTMKATVGRLRDATLEYELESRLPMRPGRYELRAAIEDAALEATGSVYGYVEIPNFAQEPVSLSGIVLDVEPRRALLTTGVLDDVLPVVPTTRRVFGRLDRVTAFVRAHQGVSRAITPGYLIVQVFDKDDRRVFQREERVLPEQFGANRALDFSLELPVSTLAPGRYLLSIEARHGNETARRDAPFTVQ